jgi:hypothetical protein
MKPEGRKPFKQHTAKHHIKGEPNGGWWNNVIEPNKTKAKREAMKEIEEELGALVSKEAFHLFQTVQDGGAFNMWDCNGVKRVGLTQEEHLNIIKNYTELQELYGDRPGRNK